MCTAAGCKASCIWRSGCNVASSCQHNICYPAPLLPGYCSRCLFWKMSNRNGINGEQIGMKPAKMFTYPSPREYPGLTLQTNGNVTHPLARFSIPQYSSTSSLQGLEVVLQPASSDMSPQSSSPLHWRVLGIQRPEGGGKTLAFSNGSLQNMTKSLVWLLGKKINLCHAMS